MNYIWDVLLRADKQKIDRKDLKFVEGKVCSPYMEVSFENLNTTLLPEDKLIEVNPYYRFQEIFKDLCNINVSESQELREVLLDIIFHYLGELDLKNGMCKTEFYKKFLKQDIVNDIFGNELRENIDCFESEELDDFLTGLITLYRTGVSLELFTKVLAKIFKNSFVYLNKDRNKPKTIYIYLGESKNGERINKIEAIKNTFLPINMRCELFWDKHFGIIGINKTMRINETVMVE